MYLKLIYPYNNINVKLTQILHYLNFGHKFNLNYFIV